MAPFPSKPAATTADVDTHAKATADVRQHDAAADHRAAVVREIQAPSGLLSLDAFLLRWVLRLVYHFLHALGTAAVCNICNLTSKAQWPVFHTNHDFWESHIS